MNITDNVKAGRRIVSRSRLPETDVEGLVRRAIAEVKGLRYNPSHGKPDRIKGLGEEVSDGSL